MSYDEMVYRGIVATYPNAHAIPYAMNPKNKVPVSQPSVASDMNDDEKGKRLTETGNYADRSLNDVKLNSQEIFYAMAYSNAEKTQKKRED
jgi:hypothetical protein